MVVVVVVVVGVRVFWILVVVGLTVVVLDLVEVWNLLNLDQKVVMGF